MLASERYLHVGCRLFLCYVAAQRWVVLLGVVHNAARESLVAVMCTLVMIYGALVILSSTDLNVNSIGQCWHRSVGARAGPWVLCAKL